MFDSVEPDLKYCLHCGEEYRADILTCATCNRELVSGKEVEAMLARQQQRSAQLSRAITSDEPVVAIKKGPAMQIKQLQAYLMDHAIASLVAADSGAPQGKG